MQPLKIPQSQIIGINGMMAGEWLVFINEFIRLCNAVITSDTINKADDAEQNSLGYASIATTKNDDVSTYVALASAVNDEPIDSVAVVITNDEPIENVAVTANQGEHVDNTPLVIQQNEQVQDNPYALISAIEQQQYEQQLWSLTV